MDPKKKHALIGVLLSALVFALVHWIAPPNPSFVAVWFLIGILNGVQLHRAYISDPWGGP